MKRYSKKMLLSLMIVAGLALPTHAALAHSFNAALLLPQAIASSDNSRQIHAGFMLATTERDSHPDQESDGHLGGLDVYVNVIDTKGKGLTEINTILRQKQIDIAINFGSLDFSNNTQLTILTPGKSPFNDPSNPDVNTFITTYETAYGALPTPYAARGYNAARRIAVAVRAQSGVDDTVALKQVFSDTAEDFTWKRPY